MEDYYNVKRLALVLAKQAEIEGMKAENAIREQRGIAIAFDKEKFDNAASELENLAYAANEQL